MLKHILHKLQKNNCSLTMPASRTCLQHTLPISLDSGTVTVAQTDPIFTVTVSQQTSHRFNCAPVDTRNSSRSLEQSSFIAAFREPAAAAGGKARIVCRSLIELGFAPPVSQEGRVFPAFEPRNPRAMGRYDRTHASFNWDSRRFEQLLEGRLSVTYTSDECGEWCNCVRS